MSGEDSAYVIDAEGRLIGSFRHVGHPSIIYNEEYAAYNLVVNILGNNNIAGGYRIWGMNDSGLFEVKFWDYAIIATCNQTTKGTIVSIETYGGQMLLFDRYMNCSDKPGRRSYILASNPDDPDKPEVIRSKQ